MKFNAMDMCGGGSVLYLVGVGVDGVELAGGRAGRELRLGGVHRLVWSGTTSKRTGRERGEEGSGQAADSEKASGGREGG